MIDDQDPTELYKGYELDFSAFGFEDGMQYPEETESDRLTTTRMKYQYMRDKMEILNKRLDEIRPYENNPRQNEKAVGAVAESIREFGFKVPLVIDKNNIIVCGHTRYKAAELLGLETVPCISAEDLTDEQVKAFRLADNKTAELAEWDPELLLQELKEITSIDMESFGFESQLLDQTEELIDDDFDEEAAKKEIKIPKTKLGDIWILGNHHLMCGDSTKPEDVRRLMNGREADMLLTDPPYNIAYEGKTKDKLTIQNDKMAAAPFIDFLTAVFKNGKEALKPGGVFYIWQANTTASEFIQALRLAELQIRETLIWCKNIFCLGRQDYQWRHEPCLYGWKEGEGHYFINDRTKSTVFDLSFDYEHAKVQDLRDYIKRLMDESTVLYEDKPRASEMHPTMKPVPLFGKCIQNSTRRNELVLDLFGGSGTTMIAAEQLNRQSYLMEFDPIYCDVIIKRWEELTGEKADRL